MLRSRPPRSCEQPLGRRSATQMRSLPSSTSYAPSPPIGGRSRRLPTAANRRALLPLRSIAPELRRAVKNPWRTHDVKVDRAAVLIQMPPAAAPSVRLDHELTLSLMTDGVLGRSCIQDGALVFTHARRLTARVEGPLDRL